MASSVPDQAAGNLPAEVTTFIGRHGELAAARRLLAEFRLVTLVGVSGVGKTRLALRLAAALRSDFPDGAWLIELSGLRDPGLLAHTVAEALQITDRSARDRVDLLAGHLAGRRALLVLDTCEHLVDACGSLARALLAAAPRLCLLATSRQALGVPGEHAMEVRPLTVPRADGPAETARFDALDLFLDRATAARPGFTLDRVNRLAVVRLCRRLDGIPLAIELAASRLRALSVEQIVERLDDRFRLLGSARTSLTRHQTLRAAVGWSHELCTPQERRMWARLSVFAGGFDLSAARRVCGANDLDAAETLSRLVEKSIVLHDLDGGCYRLLDTLREYGQERLRLSGDEEETRRRHRDRCADLAHRTRADGADGHQAEWFRRLRRDVGDLRAALEYSLGSPGEEAAGLRLATALCGFWLAEGRYGEGRHWLARALATRPGTDAELMRGLYVAGLLATLQGDFGAAKPLQREALALAERGGDPWAVAYTSQLAGMYAYLTGDFDRARTLLEESVDHLRKTDRRSTFCLMGLPLLALIACYTGDSERAIAYCDECIALCEATGERWVLAYAFYGRGLTRNLMGDAAAARRDIVRSLELGRAFCDGIAIAACLDVLAAQALRVGRPARAARLFGASEGIRETVDVPLPGLHHARLRNRNAARTREVLGEAAYAATHGEGVALAQSEAIAYALRDDEGRGPLTARQRQVAGLVADGLSNREIAERLNIAKRTADSHVEHILTRLGFSSRCQIAAWAVRPDRGSG